MVALTPTNVKTNFSNRHHHTDILSFSYSISFTPFTLIQKIQTLRFLFWKIDKRFSHIMPTNLNRIMLNVRCNYRNQKTNKFPCYKEHFFPDLNFPPFLHQRRNVFKFRIELIHQCQTFCFQSLILNLKLSRIGKERWYWENSRT